MPRRTSAGTDRTAAAPAAGARAGIVALGAVVLLSAAACFRKIWAIDFWWQYATGRLVATGGWPEVDSFSYTVAGQPWIELRWLYCWLQYGLMTFGGATAVAIVKWIAVVLAFALVASPVVRRTNRVAAAAVLTLALLAASQRFFVRPELATFVLVGLYVAILDRHRRTGSRLLFALPVLQIVWVNTHTLFVLGPALVGAMLVAEGTGAFSGGDRSETGASLPRLAAVLAATLAAGLVNPWGVEGFLFPFQLFSQIRGTAFKEAIGEFNSPLGLGGVYVAVRFYYVLIGVVVAAAALNIRRLDPFWTLFCASQLYLSLLAIRNLPLFCLAAIPFVLDSLHRSIWFERFSAQMLRAVRLAIATLVVGVCAWYSHQMVTDRFNVKQNDSNQFGVGIAEHRYPVEAVDFLERSGLDGRVFGTLFPNAYLVSRQRQVFMDPRLEVFGEAVFKRFLQVQGDAGALRQAAAEYDIEVLLVELQSRAAGVAWTDPVWELVYFDEVAALFVRRDTAAGLARIQGPPDLVAWAGKARDRLGPPTRWAGLGAFERSAIPGPFVALADFLLMAGAPGEAERFLDDAEAIYPGLSGLPLRRAAVAELRGDWMAVIAHAAEGIEETPDDPRLQIKLGAAHYRNRSWDEARSWLERSLEAMPDRARTWGMLGSVHGELQETDAAARCFETAVELEPRSVEYAANLARIRARQGRTAEAIVGLSAALGLAPRDVTILRDLAALHLATGDLASAREILSRAIAIAPEDPRLRQLEGRLQGVVP